MVAVLKLLENEDTWRMDKLALLLDLNTVQPACGILKRLAVHQTCYCTTAHFCKHLEPEYTNPLDSGRDTEMAIEEILPLSPSSRIFVEHETCTEVSPC
ncbi:hypothetical protein CEXT_110511 [Caerostris extrusa]|uniref:Uncharacterized protein n=1 Tax=Caerostris extrusa TaxID=172846 RepID=A0AAV4SVP4_CAEEX|nr:hypothetical protein CEXT_110511 [Caerostris extrusa]